MVPDDTQVPPDAAVDEQRAVPEAGADSGASGGAEGLQKKVAVMEAQLEESFKRARETGERLKETHDRLLRTAAEFDNFKKRAVKEKEDVQRFGIERLLKDFLPVMDNLERALEHAEQHDLAQVIEGVRLVQKLFETTLAEMAKGYKLNDRLVRPAAVVVAKPRTPAAANTPTNPEGGG